MKYQQAIDAAIEKAKDMKFVTREAWKAQNSYLVYLPGITHALKVNLQPKPEVTPWAANLEDSKADDWKEVDPEKVEEKVPESDPA